MASVADVRAAGRVSATFSEGLEAEERKLKRFMYDKLYFHPHQLATAEKARAVTGELFAAFAQQPELMNDGWRDTLPAQEPERSRHIADYIAGMTDRYAMDSHAQIFGRKIEGLSNV
jgi:dGTPase